MWLFEVTDEIRPGVRLVSQPGCVGVPLGEIAENGLVRLLPVGKSIARLMDHQDDRRGTFTLYRAALKYAPSGRCLVRQLFADAATEGKALVFVDSCLDQELGITVINKARNRRAPECIAEFIGDGHSRTIFLFEPEDALFICWPAAALEDGRASGPKRFIISWSGNQLLEIPCQRRLPPRTAREPAPMQSRSVKAPVASTVAAVRSLTV